MAASTDNILIRAQKLTRIYSTGSNEVVGIRDIDLEIAAGEMVVMKGNSGSGKSTLLGLLGGLDKPTRGSLTVSGQDLKIASATELNHYRRDIVGMVFQTFNLLPTLNVLENVCLPALMAGKSHEKTRDRALDYLEWLKLTERLNHYPAQLSGGEMQRTAIARALINDPSLILADEPTANLDAGTSYEIFSILEKLREEGKAPLPSFSSRVKVCVSSSEVTMSR